MWQQTNLLNKIRTFALIQPSKNATNAFIYLSVAAWRCLLNYARRRHPHCPLLHSKVQSRKWDQFLRVVPRTWNCRHQVAFPGDTEEHCGDNGDDVEYTQAIPLLTSLSIILSFWLLRQKARLLRIVFEPSGGLTEGTRGPCNFQKKLFLTTTWVFLGANWEWTSLPRRNFWGKKEENLNTWLFSHTRHSSRDDAYPKKTYGKSAEQKVRKQTMPSCPEFLWIYNFWDHCCVQRFLGVHSTM